MSRAKNAFLILAFSAAGLPAQVLRFGVIGDSGAGDACQKRVALSMAAWQQKHPWELVLMLGDNVYEDGNPSGFNRKFKDPSKTLMGRGVKFHATLGNHDRTHPGARLGCAQVEDDAFGYAGNKDEYVFEAGPRIGGKRLVRFIALNSPAWIDQYVEGKTDKTECRGTNQDRLKQFEGWLAESGKYHWNILFLHHPLYSYVYIPGLFFGHGSSTKLREILAPRLRNRVDLVLAGHDHFYQRIKPQNGIHYFVSGGAAKLRAGGNFGHSDVLAGAKRRHFLDFVVSPGEIAYQAVDETGRVFDSGSIFKPGSSGSR